MPITAGWREFADFPAWGLRRVRVKLDTGARSAAIGVRHFELIETERGPIVELHIAPFRKRAEFVHVVRAPVVGFKLVKSSSGVVERRPVVEVEVRLGPVTKRILATVADRSRMLVTVLLGRTALAPDFTVDPARKYLLKTNNEPQRHRDTENTEEGRMY